MSSSHGGSGAPPPEPERPWFDDDLPNDRQRARYRRQIEQIRDGLVEALNSPDRPGWGAPRSDDRRIALDTYPPGVEDSADALFVYRTDTLLVAPADLDDVRADLGRHEVANEEDGRATDDLGLRVLLLEPDTRSVSDRVGPARVPSPVERALAALDAEWEVRRSGSAEGAEGGEGSQPALRSVSYDRVLHVATASACPATDPEPVRDLRPLPPVAADPMLGNGVKVVVVDTALPVQSNHRELVTDKSWLKGVTGDPEVGMTRAEYRGHGMFVAGVLRTMAPKATVHVEPLVFSCGGVLESDFAFRLNEVLKEHDPDIVNLSAGTFAGPGGTVPGPQVAAHGHLLVTYDSLKVMMDGLDCLLVCAAGNNGDTEPFVPASTNWPVAVGALDAYGRRARYSNHGSYVDVYARGSDLVNAYPQGPTVIAGHSLDFPDGMARWSGTSFAAPMVAGLVAARMSWSGENAEDAWASLKGIAIVNNVGGRPILGPGDADRP